MTQYYVNQEMAFKLKELGFNEICNAYYKDGKFILKNNVQNMDCHENNCACPLYHQVINWITEYSACSIQVWALDNFELLDMQIKPFLTKTT